MGDIGKEEEENSEGYNFAGAHLDIQGLHSMQACPRLARAHGDHVSSLLARAFSTMSASRPAFTSGEKQGVLPFKGVVFGCSPLWKAPGRVNGGVRDALQCLRFDGFQTGLVCKAWPLDTASPAQRRSRSELQRHFNAIVESEHENLDRHSPQLYAMVAARAGLLPHEMVYVDSQPELLAPAHEAGMTTVRCSSGEVNMSVCMHTCMHIQVRIQTHKHTDRHTHTHVYMLIHSYTGRREAAGGTDGSSAHQLCVVARRVRECALGRAQGLRRQGHKRIKARHLSTSVRTNVLWVARKDRTAKARTAACGRAQRRAETESKGDRVKTCLQCGLRRHACAGNGSQRRDALARGSVDGLHGVFAAAMN